jgi:hypothetical protein
MDELQNEMILIMGCILLFNLTHNCKNNRSKDNCFLKSLNFLQIGEKERKYRKKEELAKVLVCE